MRRPAIRPGDGAVWCLAVAETITWAGTFYLFPALLAHFEPDLDADRSTLALAFSGALALCAVGSPIAGRLIDRGHGRTLLVGSALASAVLLVLLAHTSGWPGFVLLWLALGVCMAGCLYDPCFAFLVHTRGDGARRAITLVTLVAGFAGTVSFPVNNLVAEAHGWQAAVLTFAALIALVAVPLFWIGTRDGPAGDEQPVAVSNTPRTGPDEALRAALARPVFWLLAMAFALLYLNHITLITHLLPMLDERGIPLGQAVLTASLLGPSQVLGRVAMVSLGERFSVDAYSLAALGAVVLAALLILPAGSPQWLLLVFAVLQGAGMGVSSITRPVITAELLGRRSFGTIAGFIATGVLLATAAAPTFSAWLWTAGGYRLVLQCNLAIAVCALAGLALALALGRRRAGPAHR